jgi:hypothetical protein
MARPIKHIPSLSGKDSQRFNEAIEKSNDKPMSSEERERLKRIVHKILSSVK